MSFCKLCPQLASSYFSHFIVEHTVGGGSGDADGWNDAVVVALCIIKFGLVRLCMDVVAERCFWGLVWLFLYFSGEFGFVASVAAFEITAFWSFPVPKE